MTYSSQRNHLRVLVFTNTREDYGIAVGRGTAPAAERLIDQIARRAAPLLVPGMMSCVGLTGWPGDPDRLMAFRIFNCGTFHGRPNTLGMVAVAVPRPGDRDWSTADLLASLTVPTPGSTAYELPGQLRSASAAERPYVDLSDRETDLERQPGRLLVFTDPPGFAGFLQQASQEVVPARAVGFRLWWLWLIVPALAAVIVFAWLKWSPRPPIVPSSGPASIDDATLVRIRSALQKAKVPFPLTISREDLAGRFVVFGKTAETTISTLRTTHKEEWSTSSEKYYANNLSMFYGEYFPKLALPSTSATSRPSQSEIDRALVQVEYFARVREAMDRVEMVRSNPDTLKTRVEEFKKILLEPDVAP